MKKILFITLGIFLSLVLTGCSNDKDIIDDFTDDSVISFMNEEWSEDYLVPGFFESDGTESFCHVINCKEDLIDSYIGDKQLPNIDFNTKSLIIGQVQVPHTGYGIKKVELVKSEPLVLNIYLEEKEGGYAMLTALRFWKLYPKVSDKISMNIIKPNK